MCVRVCVCECQECDHCFLFFLLFCLPAAVDSDLLLDQWRSRSSSWRDSSDLSTPESSPTGTCNYTFLSPSVPPLILKTTLVALPFASFHISSCNCMDELEYLMCPFSCSEEISFYQGSTRERLTISKTFGDLVSLKTVQKLSHYKIPPFIL